MGRASDLLSRWKRDGALSGEWDSYLSVTPAAPSVGRASAMLDQWRQDGSLSQGWASAFSSLPVPSPVSTDWRPSYQTVQQTASVQTPAASSASAAQDWRPSYQKPVTPSPVTQGNTDGFNLPAAIGSAMEEVGTKFRNMTPGGIFPLPCRRRITSLSPMGNGARA